MITKSGISILVLGTILLYNLSWAQNPTLDWATGIGGGDEEWGWAITVDEIGNVYTTGSFTGSVDFDPGIGTEILSADHTSDIFVLKQDPTGALVWAKQMEGAGRGNSIVVDDNGNVYVTGFFSDTTDFDSGPGNYDLISVGDDDIFVQKLSSAGDLIWVKQMGGTSGDIGWSIDVDNDGNVYTTGEFRNSVDFDPGAGVLTLIANGIRNVYLQKLNANGNLVWVSQIGSTGSNSGWDLTLDSFANVYSTGFFKGTTDFDPGTGTTNLTANGVNDVYVQKVDSSGNFLWARNMGGPLADNGAAITVGGDGNVYTTGAFTDTADFDPGAGVHLLYGIDAFNIFVQKMDPLGNFIWAVGMQGENSIVGSYGRSIAVDNSNSVFISGEYRGTVDFDPGTGVEQLTAGAWSNGYVQKLDSMGNLVWVHSIGGASNDWIQSICIDDFGAIYGTGTFLSTTDFDPGVNTQNLTSNGSSDVCVFKWTDGMLSSQESENDITSDSIIFSVFPNPTQGFLTVTFEESKETIPFRIVDVNGRPISNGQLDQKQNSIDMVEMDAGVYFLIIGENNVIRLIKK